LTLQAVKTICSNADFINNVEVKVGTDGPVPSLNTKYDVVKEIPHDAQVSTNNLLKCRVFLVGLEVLTAVVMKSPIFWDMTPCSPLKINRR
jgi:hypothetical protein